MGRLGNPAWSILLRPENRGRLPRCASATATTHAQAGGVSAALARAIDPFEFYTDPQRKSENHRGKYLERVPSCVPPINSRPSKDPNSVGACRQSPHVHHATGAQRPTAGAAIIPLTHWGDHRSCPLSGHCTAMTSRHRSLNSGDGFLLSGHEMGGQRLTRLRLDLDQRLPPISTLHK